MTAKIKGLPTIETYNQKNKKISETKTERDKRLKGIYSKNQF